MSVIRSLPGVCEVTTLRGANARPDSPPDVVFEMPHGATLARHFAALRAQLRGEYPPDLQDFFFVNTDVGSPELAAAIAQRVIAAEPRRSCVLVRCLLPRTFVDCNRRIDRATAAAPTHAGQMTPGLPPWIRDEADRELLLDRYAAYRSVATAAFEAVCGSGGLGLCVHTYAPRSVDVAVDDHIVASMHSAYAPDRVGTWPLRAEVDLITHDPDGRDLSPPALALAAEERLAAAGIQVVRNQAYALHPVTLAHEFAVRHAGRVLCFEVRRDQLVREFTPFREMTPDPARVARVAAPFAEALLATLR